MHTSDEFLQMYSHVTTTTVKRQNIEKNTYLFKTDLYSVSYKPSTFLSTLQMLTRAISITTCKVS